MASINGIPIYVISEERQYENETTDHPVEDGQDITDHVINLPIVFQIEGEYTGPDAGQIDAQLRTLRRTGQLLKYVGRASMVYAVIESYVSSVDSSIANGLRFSMTIKNIKLAKTSTVSLLAPAMKAQVKEVGNAGRVQTK